MERYSQVPKLGVDILGQGYSTEGGMAALRGFAAAHPEAEVAEEQIAAFAGLVARRRKHEPLQYLVGHQEFYGLELRVTPAVLIPRPETEILVEAVLEWLTGRELRDASLQIVDVGTGSGAIALALAANLPKAKVWALDNSPPTRAVVEENAERLGLAERVTFLESDLLKVFRDRPELGHLVDIVVSNPPYVSSLEAPNLEAQVREFEPHTALFAGEDGLAVYRRLIPEAWEAMRPGGLLAMEFGFGQWEALAALLAGCRDVRFFVDLAGIPRVVLAELG